MEIRLFGIRLNSPLLGKMLQLPFLFPVVQLWLPGQGLPVPPITEPCPAAPLPLVLIASAVLAMSPCCRAFGGLRCHLLSLGGWSRCQRTLQEGTLSSWLPCPPAACGQPRHLSCPFPAAVACSVLDVPPMLGMSWEGLGAWTWPSRAVWLSAAALAPARACQDDGVVPVFPACALAGSTGSPLPLSPAA